MTTTTKLLIFFGVFLAVGFTGMALNDNAIFASAIPAAAITALVLFFMIGPKRKR
jgi:hypothetical protein